MAGSGSGSRESGPTTDKGVPVGLLGGEFEFGTPIAQDAPPIDVHGVKELFRDNLFKDLKNTVLTLVFSTILGFLLVRAFLYVFVTARWEVIEDGPLVFYMVGPDFNRTGISYEMLWAGVYVFLAAIGLGAGIAAAKSDAPPPRVGTKLAMYGAPTVVIAFVLSLTNTITPTLVTLGAVAALAIALQIGKRVPESVQRRSTLLLVVLAALGFGLITGFSLSNIDEFGGLLLTTVVAFTGIGLSFPIGVIMALARRSSFPLIRPIAVGYIELIRGVPLISLLFIGQFALGFLFPPGVTVPGPIPRAIIVIALFSGAYVAEIVRGGLQSVPKGQTEAGQAIGLSAITITRKIVLPQALRNSIPALIGQFISLLKDVSLLVIIGQQEMLGVVDIVLARQEFLNKGYTPEAYAFVGAVYWVLCFTMSRAAQRLETRLGVGTR